MYGSDNDEHFYDILLELSNDVRHKILLLLKDMPERVKQIAKNLGLPSRSKPTDISAKRIKINTKRC